MKTKVAIIGIGRVGLPLALVLAEEGYHVYGLGRDEAKLAKMREGVMPFIEVEADSLLKKHINTNFFPLTDYSVIEDCDYIILTLGTPIDENMNPVYDQINTALDACMPYLTHNQTLILRSTVSPKTTEYVAQLLQDKKKFIIGENFYLAFCPERIAEGYSIDEIKSIPQIIGGLDRKSAKKAAVLFEKIGVEVLLTDAVSAELAKLFTNMYRYINFAIANEFMVLADNYNRDIYEIVNLVNYKYKRGGLKVPGLTGGPCLFKDGFFLISSLPFIDLIATSWKINESVPLLLVQRVAERKKLAGKKVVILGLSFKSDIDDIRESLSFKIRKAVLQERAEVVLQDPYVKEFKGLKIETDVYTAITGADVIFVACNHSEYKKLNLNKIKKLVNKDCIISDIWNVFKTDKIVCTINHLVNDEKTKNINPTV